MTRMKTLLGILKQTWDKQSLDTKAKLIFFGPIVVAVLIVMTIGTIDAIYAYTK